MHGKYLRKIQLPYLHFLLQFDHNSCEATAIVAESENASTATEPDAGQSETNAETERTETTEVITEDSTETPAPVEVSGSTENSTILPLSYEDFNVNGFGYSNYVDLYGAGNGYEDVERISIMTTNCTAYTEYPDQMSSDTETSRGIKLGDSREQVIAAYGESRNEFVLTLFFLLVILGATDKFANGKFAGVAIGLALTLIHLISIPITNTSVNPALKVLLPQK
jgi:hypothetical protein